MTSTKIKKKSAWFVLSCAVVDVEAKVPPKGSKKFKPGATAGMPGDGIVPSYKVKIRKPAAHPPHGLYSSDHIGDLSSPLDPLLVDGTRVNTQVFKNALLNAAKNREDLERVLAIKDPVERSRQLPLHDGNIVAYYVQKATFGSPVEVTGPLVSAAQAAWKKAAKKTVAKKKAATKKKAAVKKSRP